MHWVNVELFPLNENLSRLIQILQAQGLVYRVVELNGQQALQVSNAEAVAPMQALVAKWRAGAMPPETRSNESMHAYRQAATLSPWRTPVTLLLVALSVCGFAMLEFNFLHFLEPYFTFYTLVNNPMAGINSGEYWRLLTPVFIHFGIFHIVFNALWLWDLGRRIELSLGAPRYLLFFVVAAVMSNLIQHFWQIHLEQVQQVAQFGGMSGVVYAMVGYIAVCQKLNPQPVFNVPMGIILFMLGWLVLCLTGIVDYFMSGGIANGAHVGGLLAGVLMALFKIYVWNKPKRNK